ncbi:hypothetical protein [Streptomyces microflavus]|uniref:hypothetical protein n=1 Tax=Streptomyces microflavus TaxID=1919 RepID=UPI003254A670
MTTTTHPLAAAEQQLTNAIQTHAEATAVLGNLKQQILNDGPQAVTAQQLADAAASVEHAKLSTDHALTNLQTAQEDDRQGALNALKATILNKAGTPADALQAMRQLEEAARYLMATCVSRQQNIHQWTAALRQAGVPQAHAGTAADGHAGLGWAPAGMGQGDTVIVDGRRLATVNPGLLIAAALTRAARATGHGLGHLAPVVEVHAPQGLAVDDPDGYLHQKF